MNIYFSCSITGGRQDQQVYHAIVELLQHDGHEVPTAHLSRADVMEKETTINPAEVYHRDLNWVLGCDALIAEVSTPSHGVGYEIALALQHHKPVLCCYQSGQRVSKMITGNDSPTLKRYAYQSLEDLLPEIDRFLKNIRLQDENPSGV
jgi:2'-deoxynucleoside 5'-phosphate N-hydrolase